MSGNDSYWSSSDYDVTASMSASSSSSLTPPVGAASNSSGSLLDHFDIDDEILKRLESLQSHTIAGVIIVMILVIVLIVDVFCYVFNQWGGLWLIVSYCCGRRRLRTEEKERLQAASRWVERTGFEITWSGSF